MTALLITCEHGGHRIPPRFRPLFRDAAAALDSHRGWDPGALPLARHLSRRLDAPLIHSETSRLLVDLNRSVRHPRNFSEWTRPLPDDVKQDILAKFYWPYRESVIAEIRRLVRARRKVLHVSVHSFTPELNGDVRRADIGLLYDPGRPRERAVCTAWKAELRQIEPDLCVLRNSPYRGVSDGFTTALRREFPDAVYAGVELEINQRLVPPNAKRHRLFDSLCRSLQAVVATDL